jgi:hypothetical protein
MKSQAACYRALRDALEQMPIVDCHDHSGVCGPQYKDAIGAVVNGYFPSDVQSATSEQDGAAILDASKPLEERWPLLEKAWKRTCHTGYAQVARRVMQHFYGEEALTLEALQRMQGKLLNLEDEATYTRILDEAHIVARVEDCWPDVKGVVEGRFKPSPRGRLAISLPGYHQVCNYTQVQQLVAPLGLTVTSLDEYLDACRRIFEAHKAVGAVTFKDQSAYTRTLDYGNPTRSEAEAVFNWFMEDPRRSASYPDGVKPLDDYLWHAFMRMAQDMDLPVQIHTGHMAGIRNDITKTNAVYLTKTIELHRDVRFDLFHANWPYDGEFIYLGKNYPNVALDFCWANIIDPIYCQRLFQQVLSAVPHGKVHGYGSDYGGTVDRAWAHASIARDNIAIALAELVEMEYIALDEAQEVAYGWLFANANAFFRLGVS